MLRRLVLACGLLPVGAVLAGCGGGNQGAVRQEAKQLLGDGNPKILGIESVRDVGGNRQVVATLQGNFKLAPASGCGLVGPCRPSPRPPIHYAWLSFSQPRGMTGIQTTSASQLAAIDNAKSAKPIFGIFPGFTNPALHDPSRERIRNDCGRLHHAPRHRINRPRRTCQMDQVQGAVAVR